jgi:hypothetical protein
MIIMSKLSINLSQEFYFVSNMSPVNMEHTEEKFFTYTNIHIYTYICIYIHEYVSTFIYMNIIRR